MGGSWRAFECVQARAAGAAHETPLTATQQAIQRDFPLLKTDEWMILPNNQPKSGKLAARFDKKPLNRRYA